MTEPDERGEATVAIPLERTHVGPTRAERGLALGLVFALASWPLLFGPAYSVILFVASGVMFFGLRDTWLGAFLFSVAGLARKRGEMMLLPEGTARVLNGPTDQSIDGLSLASAAGKVVELTTRDGRFIRLVCKHAEDTERIVAHLGMRVEDRAIRAPLRSVVGAKVLGFVAFGLAAIGTLISVVVDVHHVSGWPQLGTLTAALLFAIVFGRRFGDPKVTVGKDGIRVSGGFRSGFVPFSAVRGVRFSPPNVTVQMDHGMLELPVVGQSSVQVAALIARIERGMAIHARSKATALVALARDARPIAEWRAELERRAGNAVGFRDASMATQERLEEILSDPSAPLDQRVGAVLMLRVADPEAPVRVRVEIERAADERVGRALEAAIAEEVDDVALERALSGS